MRSQPLFSTLYRIAIGVLAFSGLLQMPIAKRYYLASLPGFVWLGDYHVTHQIHYWAAALFLLLVLYRTTLFLAARRGPPRLTGLGAARAGLLLVVIVTGILRVLKNRPELYFTPPTVMLIDLLHLAGVILFGLLVLSAALSRRRSYWDGAPYVP